MLSARFSFPVTAACALLWLMLENLCRHRKERDPVQLEGTHKSHPLSHCTATMAIYISEGALTFQF